jgi:hypothetical protein
MKIFTSLLISVAILSLMEVAQAAGSDPKTEAALTRTKDLKNCNDNHSNGEEDWRDRIFTAEEKYRETMEAIEGTGIEQVSASGGTLTPVGTQPANSWVEEKGPDHKGFMQSTQE